MIVNTNVQAINSHRSLSIVADRAARASEKLASGLAINRAGDDAAGLAISEKMRAQIRGLERASTNAQDGISAIQTAEGAMQETHEMLRRLIVLTTQAANDILVTQDRVQIQHEINNLVEEIDLIAVRTQFNTRTLLSGSFGAPNAVGGGTSNPLFLQVGANSGEGLRIGFGTLTLGGLFSISTPTSGTNMAHHAARVASVQLILAVGGTSTTAASMVSGQGLVVAGGGSAISQNIQKIQNAIDIVSSQRAILGAMQNRLEHTIRNLDITVENLSASESRIRDTDMAKQMMEFTQGNVLTQAAQTMLAHANMAPQQVLQLLG